MSSDEGRDWKSFQGWGRDVSTNVVGGLLTAAIVAVCGLAVSFLAPVRSWIFGFVFLYGWSLVLLVVGSALIGFFLGRRLIAKRVEVPSPFAVSAVPRDRPSFQPDELGERVIDVLRYADGRWVSLAQLIKFLEVHSRQDLILSVRSLSTEGWAEEHEDNYIRKEDAQSFRLGPPGVAFAKAKGFQTQTEFERSRKVAGHETS